MKNINLNFFLNNGRFVTSPPNNFCTPDLIVELDRDGNIETAEVWVPTFNQHMDLTEDVIKSNYLTNLIKEEYVHAFHDIKYSESIWKDYE